MARPRTLTDAIYLDSMGRAATPDNFKIAIYKRGNIYYSYMRFDKNKYSRQSLNETESDFAKTKALKLYLDQLERVNAGLELTTHTFRYCAKAWLRTFQQELERDSFREPKPKSYKSRKQWAAFWKATVNDFLCHNDSPLYNKTVPTISPKDITYYINWRRKQENKESGLLPSNHIINRQLQCIRAIMQYALALEWIKTVPEIKNVKAETGKREHFEESEVTRIWDRLDTWDTQLGVKRGSWARDRSLMRAWVKMLFLTGARPGEMKRLRYNEIDYSDGIRLLLDGKTGKRWIYVSDKAKAVFDSWRNDPRNKYTNDNDYVFSTKMGEPYSTRCDHAFDSLLKDLKLEYRRDNKGNPIGLRRTLYCTRHTFITTALRKRVPIADILQHCDTSYKQLRDHYGEHMPLEASRRVVEIMQ